MFGDVGQAGTNAAMLLPMIATTLSRTCTKPIVSGRFNRDLELEIYIQQNTFFHLFQKLVSPVVFL